MSLSDFSFINIKGPQTVLMKDCPKENGQKSFKENDIISMKKIEGSILNLPAKVFFSLDDYQLKNMG